MVRMAQCESRTTRNPAPAERPVQQASPLTGTGRIAAPLRFASPLILLAFVGPACEDAQRKPAVPESPRPLFEHYKFTVVPWISDADGNEYLLDTASPRTQVMPGVIGHGTDYFAERTVETPKIRGIDMSDTPVIVSDALSPAFQNALENGGQENFGGVIGGDIFARRDFAFDARESRILFGDPLAHLSHVGSGTEIGARLKGGGSTCLEETRCYEYGATRWIVDIEVDGITSAAIVDTAATYLVASRALIGRVQRLGGGKTASLRERRPNGDREREIGIFNNVVIGGKIELNDVGMAVGNADLDAGLARLQVETGERVEMLLGQSVLQRFVTEFSVDPPTLKLRQYEPPAGDPYPVPQTGVGFSFSQTEACPMVDSIVSGTPVDNSGLHLGDCIVSINGIEHAEPEWADQLQGSEPGDVFHIGAERDGVHLDFLAEHVPLLGL